MRVRRHRRFKPKTSLKMTDNLKHWMSALRPRNVSTMSRSDCRRQRSRRLKDLRNCCDGCDGAAVAVAAVVVDDVVDVANDNFRRFPSGEGRVVGGLRPLPAASNVAPIFCRPFPATKWSTKTRRTSFLRSSSAARSPAIIAIKLFFITANEAK
jgi:hypothetical protein